MNKKLVVKSESTIDTTNTEINPHNLWPDDNTFALACVHSQNQNI